MASAKAQRIVGWVLSGLLALLLAGPSAMGKFTDWEGKAEMLEKMNFSNETLFKIGVVELAVTALFLIPRTAFVGTILLTAYLGGAVVTHVRMGDAFIMPIVVGVVAWIALGLRQAGVFGLAFRPTARV